MERVVKTPPAPPGWWKDPVQHAAIRAFYDGSSQKAARQIGNVSSRNAQQWWSRMVAAGCVDASGRPTGVPVPTRKGGHLTPEARGDSEYGGAQEIAIDPTMVRWSDSDLMAFHNIDPETSIIVKRQAKRWNQALGEGQVAEMNGLTLTIESRYPADTILPARAEGWKPPRRGAAIATAGTRVITVSTDWHLPYQDEGLFDCYLQVLRELKPDEDWDLGDLVDYPQPSRHRMTKGFEATPQQCVDARYKHDAERVAAAPKAVHKRLYGNHDERVDHAVRDKVGAHVARLARAGDTLPVLDLAHLLRYDELGIEVLRPDGDYHSVVAKIVEGLNVAHGTKSGPFGGAVKRIVRRVASMLTGHDHKQALKQVTAYDENDQAVLTIAASIGCGCQRALARSYAEDADAHLGFAVVTDHGNGSFNVELARYDDTKRELYFRGKVYRPRCA